MVGRRKQRGAEVRVVAAAQRRAAFYGRRLRSARQPETRVRVITDWVVAAMRSATHSDRERVAEMFTSTGVDLVSRLEKEVAR